ncbi:MAG: Holliday junction resolvase RuvX [Solirubrobacterales bacterium]
MRVLALDHGAARCGCAVSDPTGTIVTPLSVVQRPDSGPGLTEIERLVKHHDAELVLIGLPLLQSGESGAQAAAVRSFAGRLGGRIDVPVELFDERFTTQMAQSSLAEGAASDEDSLAAAHLLEDYLAQKIQTMDGTES